MENPIVAGTHYGDDPGRTAESRISAISWPAIFGGAVGAAAIGVVLVTIGSGFGLASVSMRPNVGATPATFVISAGIWLIVVQWISAGLGGYLTGRLRTKWVNAHTHEVFFRDTAHGFLTWATASVIGAAVIGMAASSAVGTGTRAAATVAAGAAAATPAMQARAYGVDSLLRGEKPEFAASSRDTHAEASRILAQAMVNGEVPAGDRSYLADIITSRTGVTAVDAQKRVDDVITREKAAVASAKVAADAARKYTATAAIFTGLSMLIGAFIASIAAAYGGSWRDEQV